MGVGLSVGLDAVGFGDGLDGVGVAGLVCEIGVGFSDGLDEVGVCDTGCGVIGECTAVGVCETGVIPPFCFFARPGGMQPADPGVQPHPVFLP